MPLSKHSIYPTTKPPKSETLVKYNENDFSLFDKFVVGTSSLVFVGGVFWVPALYAWAVKRYRAIPKDQVRRKALYAAFIFSITAFFVAGPHRKHTFDKWVQVRKWKLWESWLKFFAFEVIADQGYDSIKKYEESQAIVAVSPHGIFPFALAFSVLSDAAKRGFGTCRAVVASATQMIPWVRDVLKWVHAVDASRPAVDRALSEGSRIGIAPGGIAEMFEGYPKPKTHPDEEYSIIRKGIFKMAIKHNVPIIPVYCFGSTKLLKRVELPAIVEKLSLMLRTSLVLFFGQWGLPIPFRQKLLYVIGKAIHPPSSHSNSGQIADINRQAEEMLSTYCDEMVRIFDRHKESYGWAHKELIMLPR